MAEFTPTQGRYLAFIYAYTNAYGLPPAESEIAVVMNVSPPSVNQMMRALEKKALIRRAPGVARSIEILIPVESIPKWKGRIPQSTKKVWMRVAPQNPPAPKAGQGGVTAYQFKITLNRTKPPIWRRVETTDVTLKKLHEMIQTAMGWTNSHLHQFEIGGKHFTDMEFIIDDFNAEDYSEIKISDLVNDLGPKLRIKYEYDFGDGWEHDIVLEKVIQTKQGELYPRCIDGSLACPPEDIGGVYGFVGYVEAITDSQHAQHEEMLELNGPFDPTAFSAIEATKRMQRGLRKMR